MRRFAMFAAALLAATAGSTFTSTTAHAKPAPPEPLIFLSGPSAFPNASLDPQEVAPPDSVLYLFQVNAALKQISRVVVTFDGVAVASPLSNAQLSGAMYTGYSGRILNVPSGPHTIAVTVTTKGRGAGTASGSVDFDMPAAPPPPGNDLCTNMPGDQTQYPFNGSCYPPLPTWGAPSDCFASLAPDGIGLATDRRYVGGTATDNVDQYNSTDGTCTGDVLAAQWFWLQAPDQSTATQYCLALTNNTNLAAFAVADRSPGAPSDAWECRNST